MMTLNERTQHEIEHGRFLAQSGNPEKIWNWDSPAGRVRAKRRAELLREAAHLDQAQSVLEIGCGTGTFTALLARAGLHILAIDLSPDLLALAHQRGLPADQVTWAERRFEDGHFDHPFDAIFGSSVLHHLDIEASLPRLFALLKPKGWLAFAEPNLLNPQVWMERNIPAVRRRLGVSPDETAIVRWRLARQLKEAGFQAVSIRNVDWLHPATPPALIPAVSNLGLVLEKLPLIREFTGSVIIRAQRP
jgi:2-polyprenyl-3-methyl-5-hydroxy-6-metoxy-1,4-benzoquinol methylase